MSLSSKSWRSSMSALKCLHEFEMLMAVSRLSPVSTQTLMPAMRNASSVSGTLSWSRSSTAVAPTSCICVSITSYTCANRSSRLSDMSSYASLSNWSYMAMSAGDMTRHARASVRQPSWLNFVMAWFRSFTLLVSLSKHFANTEFSAPFFYWDFCYIQFILWCMLFNWLSFW